MTNASVGNSSFHFTPVSQSAPTGSVEDEEGGTFATAVAGPTGATTLCPLDCEALRQQLLGLVNEDRSAERARPLTLYAAATQAGQAHAEDMLYRDYFSHLSPEGATPGDRLAKANAGPASTWGENIWMFESGTLNGKHLPIEDWHGLVARAEDAWMHSPGHKKNILDDSFTHLGVGISYAEATGEVRMVQVFFTPAR